MMVELYGQTMTKRELAACSGSIGQFAGVRLMTLEDGLERGLRLLEFRGGTGLRFTVSIDRAFDIADCEYNGMAIGWHSPAGFRHPGLHEPEGEGGLGWLRSFSGLMVTCGLDHILFMDEAPAEHFNYSPRQSVKNSIHGRVSAIPAKLSGYGEVWKDNICTFWAEGIVKQGTVFGEHLELRRRIEIDLGSNEIRLSDTITNLGFYKTPHMYCYHINVGYPVLAEGSRYLAAVQDVVWAAHEDEYERQNVGYQTMPAPQQGFHEQVWQHELTADEHGLQSVALINDQLTIGIEIVTNKQQFPCMFEWQNFQSGQYAFGIEPSTNHVLGAEYARENNEMIILDHGEKRTYDTTFRILPDQISIEDAESRISKMHGQPAEKYPKPSNNHVPLRQEK